MPPFPPTWLTLEDGSRIRHCAVDVLLPIINSPDGVKRWQAIGANFRVVVTQAEADQIVAASSPCMPLDTPIKSSPITLSKESRARICRDMGFGAPAPPKNIQHADRSNLSPEDNARIRKEIARVAGRLTD